MTFGNNQMPYRITLDTNTQTFIVIDKENQTKVGQGNTIQSAIADLNKNLVGA